MKTQEIHPEKTSPSIFTADSIPPNFPPCRQERFILALESATDALALPPLGAYALPSLSGTTPPLWELQIRTLTGRIAGSCLLNLSPAGADAPSPRKIPHPVLGEWFSALRYTGCLWTETGRFAVSPGFSEEAVLDALWDGLIRLMRRNGVNFLVGAAPDDSLVLARAVRQGARVLEPGDSGSMRYFLYAF